MEGGEANMLLLLLIAFGQVRILFFCGAKKHLPNIWMHCPSLSTRFLNIFLFVNEFSLLPPESK